MVEDRSHENPIFSDTEVVADDEHIDNVVAQNRNRRHGMDTVVDKAIHDGSLGFSALGVEDQSIASSASSGVKMAVEEEQTGLPTERNQDIQDNATDILMESAIGKMAVTSAETVNEQEYPGSENCGTAIVKEEGQVEARYIESPMEQVRYPSDATAGTDLTGPAVIMQDQQHPISKKSVVSGTEADQKRRKYVLTTGDDPFQSLDAEDKTPPTSPGGESSCSTLVDPSSRKVSPSELTMGADASPTAVKDLAYAPWDSNHVRDPMSIIEGNMKLELVRQLERKNMAGERKACREAEKQKGRNQTLSAEVEEARRNLLNREVRADLANVHANAMILSNVVHRQSKQDIEDGMTRGQRGAKDQMTRSAGETFRNQEKEGSLRNHLECAGTFTASAYACTQRSEYATETSGEGLDDVVSQGCIQQESMPPKGENLEPQQSSPIEALDRQISEELHAGWIVSKDSATNSGGAQLKPNAEEPLGRSKGKVVDALFGKPVLDAAMLVDTTISLDPAVSEAIKDVKLRVPEVTAVTDETDIAAIFEDNQQACPNTYKDPGTDDALKVLTNSKAQNKNLPLQQDNTQKGQIFSECSFVPAPTKSFEMANSGNNSPQEPPSEDSSPTESSGINDVLDANDDNSPSTDAHPQLQTDLEQNDTQGTCIGHEDGSNGIFEFSEAAGPATLWGILHSNRCEIKAENKAYTVEEATGVSDAAGPATLWGILRSNQSENGAEDRGVVEEEVAVVSAVPGAATLWGILQSNAHKSEVGEQEDADDAAADNPEVESSGPATESGEVAPPMLLRVYGLGEIEEGPRGPTNTPVEPTNSSHETVDGEGVSEAGDDVGNGSAGDATGARCSDTEACSKVSENIHHHGGAKSGDSDTPSLEAIAAEKKRPEGSGGRTLQAPAVFGDLYTSHDNFGAGAKGEDHKTGNVAIVASSNTLARTCHVLSGGKGNQELSLNPSDISPPCCLSQPEAKVCDLISPISQPNEMSKTQKRKLERRRAAAKKAEAKELMPKKEEEAGESMCQKEEEDKEAAPAPASLVQRLAEEDSKLGEKRRMLQLARMAREEKVEAALRSKGKSAGR